MNWQEIKEKCPKAHFEWEYFLVTTNKKCLQWTKYETDTDILVDYNKIAHPNMLERILYDFFDEQGIQLEVAVAYTGDKDTWFEFYIYNNFTLVWCSMDEEDYGEPYKTKTRTEAEEQAFLKAFSILENKLTGTEDV